MQRLAVCLFSLSMSFAVAPTTTLAQANDAGDPKAAAKAAFQAGVRAYASSDYEVALQAFERAYSLAPHPMVRVNIANCYDFLKKPAQALYHFRAFLAEAGDERPEQAAEVTAAIKRLEGQTARLTIEVEPASALVAVDGESVEIGDEPLVLPSGEHEIVASRLGFAQERRTVQLKAGKAERLSLVLVAEARQPTEVEPGQVAAQPGNGPETTPVPASSEAVPPALAAASDPGGGRRITTAVLVTGAIAVGLGLGAAVTGVLALGAQSDYEGYKARTQPAPGTPVTQSNRLAYANAEAAGNRANGLALVTDILAITAVLSGATTVYLYVTQGEKPRRLASLRPVLGMHHAGLNLTGAF